MKILKELEITMNGKIKTVAFGHPETTEEKNAMFQFRFNEYSSHKYIDPERFPNGQEHDEYDSQNKCVYFVAVVDNKIIGTVRLIKDKILPTEQDFYFPEQKEIKSIDRNSRAELGRLIIVPYDKERKMFFPRGIIMLMLLATLIDFGLKNNIDGGYAFVKSSFKKKMVRLKLPAHFISSYKQRYPKDGILYRYFNQPEDPVVPMYFITKEFKGYVDKIFNKKWVFKITGNKTVLKNTTLIYILNILGFL